MFKNKTLNIVISFILAVCLWAFVVIVINPQATKTFEGIEIQFLNQDGLEARGLAVGNSTEVTTVDVVVVGNSNTLNTMTIDDISITADLFNRDKGENSIPIVVQVPEGVNVESLSQDSVIVDIEDNITVDKEVELRIVGSIPTTYKLKTTILDPSRIEISGAESLVEKVEKVEVEVSSDAITSTSVTVVGKVKAYNNEGIEIQGLKFSTNNVNATLEFTEEEKEEEVETVSIQYLSGDISINNLNENYEAAINEENVIVKVTGTKEAIATLKKEDIILSINLDGLSEGTHTVIIKPNTSGIYSKIEVNPQDIEVTITLKEGGSDE